MVNQHGSGPVPIREPWTVAPSSPWATNRVETRESLVLMPLGRMTDQKTNAACAGEFAPLMSIEQSPRLRSPQPPEATDQIGEELPRAGEHGLVVEQKARAAAAGLVR